MTPREKLADWISGGALTRAMQNLAFEENSSSAIKDIHLGSIREANTDFFAMCRVAKKLKTALDRIAAEEKPTSNATVKRMAKIAREALK
jgi:hypothetical protein